MNKVKVYMSNYGFYDKILWKNKVIDKNNIKLLKYFDSEEYGIYRLSTMFDLGLSDKINETPGIDKNVRKKIIKGTISARQSLGTTLGILSNMDVAGLTETAFKNKIGLNTVFLNLGFFYKNAKKIKIIRNFKKIPMLFLKKK